MSHRDSCCLNLSLEKLNLDWKLKLLFRDVTKLSLICSFFDRLRKSLQKLSSHFLLDLLLPRRHNQSVMIPWCKWQTYILVSHVSLSRLIQQSSCFSQSSLKSFMLLKPLALQCKFIVEAIIKSFYEDEIWLMIHVSITLSCYFYFIKAASTLGITTQRLSIIDHKFALHQNKMTLRILNPTPTAMLLVRCKLLTINP